MRILCFKVPQNVYRLHFVSRSCSLRLRVNARAEMNTLTSEEEPGPPAGNDQLQDRRSRKAGEPSGQVRISSIAAV